MYSQKTFTCTVASYVLLYVQWVKSAIFDGQIIYSENMNSAKKIFTFYTAHSNKFLVKQ